MRRELIIAAAAVAVLGLAPGAQARPLPDGGVTPDEVARVMQHRGFRAEITTADDGRPLIKSSSSGYRFGVYFYGCKQDRCPSIQFASAFDMADGMSLKSINEWNRTSRFGRAYLDDESDPFIEMDVDVERGFTTEALSNNLSTWEAVLGRFREFASKHQ